MANPRLKESVKDLAKRKLKNFLYPNDHVRRGGLKAAANAMGVSYGTIRKWAVEDWIPSETNARRVLLWIGTNPVITDKTGTTRKPKRIRIVRR